MLGLILVAGAWLIRGSMTDKTKEASGSKPQASVSELPAREATSKAGGDSAVSAKPSAQPQPAAAADSSAQAGAPFSATNDPDHIHFAFVGDILLGSTVENVLKQEGYDAPYKAVKPIIQRADLALANLETPITERGVGQDKTYIYRSSPKALPALADAGFDVVNLANNHVLDYGPEGLLDTLDSLDRAGIRKIGAGRDKDEAYRPVILEKKGIKTAFLGFSRVVPEVSWKAGKDHPGVAETYDYTVPVEAIKQARTQADLVVVMTHWGEERKDKPASYQTDLAHRYIDAGADLVVASHPHVLQGIEAYKGKWVAYSLGNFIFTTNNVKETWETIILEAACSRDGKCGLHAVPVYTVGGKPEPMQEEAGKSLLERLAQISFHTKIDPSGQIEPASP